MKRMLQNRGFVFLALAQIMVGGNIVCSKILVHEIPTLVLLCLRFNLSAIILLFLHIISNIKQPKSIFDIPSMSKTAWGMLGLQAIFAGVLFNIFMIGGLHFSDANIAGIITSALPMLITLFGWLFLQEVMTSNKIISVGIASFGLLFIGLSKLSGQEAENSLFGDLLIFISLLPEAGYYILVQKFPNKLPVFLASSIMNGINGIILLPSLMLMTWSFAAIEPWHWMLILFLGMGSGLFFVFWYLGAQTVDHTLSSLSTAIMPIATVLIAWMALGERLSIYEGMGMVLILFSIVLYARRH